MPATAIVQTAIEHGALDVARMVSRTHSVPAVERVFAILELLAQSRTGLSVRELAGLSGLPKSSVHGILITLRRCGYLHRDERTSRYLFARRLFLLANHALSGLWLRERAEPHMRLLARGTRLPVYLGIVERDDAVVVAKVEHALSSRRTATWVGKRMDLHCTGLGKALLADWTDADLRRFAQERTLSRHNENTVSTLRRLIEEAVTVRRLGYAIDDEEDALGVRSVGAPVRDREGRVICAISVAGATEEITAENVQEVGHRLLVTAHAVGCGLKEACSEVPQTRQ